MIMRSKLPYYNSLVQWFQNVRLCAKVLRWLSRNGLARWTNKIPLVAGSEMSPDQFMHSFMCHGGGSRLHRRIRQLVGDWWSSPWCWAIQISLRLENSFCIYTDDCFNLLGVVTLIQPVLLPTYSGDWGFLLTKSGLYSSLSQRGVT